MAHLPLAAWFKRRIANGTLLGLSLVYLGLAGIFIEAATIWHLLWPALLAGGFVVAAAVLFWHALPPRARRSRFRLRLAVPKPIRRRSETVRRTIQRVKVPDTVEALLQGSQ